MSRLRCAITLLLVALVAMVIGLAASTLLARMTSHRGSDPEAIEPQRPAASSSVVVNA